MNDASVTVGIYCIISRLKQIISSLYEPVINFLDQYFLQPIMIIHSRVKGKWRDNAVAEKVNSVKIFNNRYMKRIWD